MKHNNSKVHRLSERSTNNIITIIGKRGKIIHNIIRIYYKKNNLRYSQAYNESYKVMQGSTYDTVFVDVNNMVFDSNGIPYADQDELLRRLYVACSRARKNLILCYGN